MTEIRCIACNGEGWVCENDHNRPWNGISAAPDACTCSGCAGTNCRLCNPSTGKDDPPGTPPGFNDEGGALQ
jgi:hypothetical protein